MLPPCGDCPDEFHALADEARALMERLDNPSLVVPGGHKVPATLMADIKNFLQHVAMYRARYR